MKLYTLKNSTSKTLIILCLGLSISQIYADESIEGFCYPKDLTGIYNGRFFSYSHISMKDYQEIPEFKKQFSVSTMLNPANQKIPTFWYKIKNVGHFVVNEFNTHVYDRINIKENWTTSTIETTYGKINHPIYSTDSGRNGSVMKFSMPDNAKFALNLSSKVGIVTYKHENMKVICNEDDGKELKSFKFNRDDAFTLPVKLENDNPLPTYKPEMLPNQGGYCRNEKLYPGLRILWAYQNGSGTLTIRQESKEFLDIGGEKEKSFNISRQGHMSGRYFGGFISEIGSRTPTTSITFSTFDSKFKDKIGGSSELPVNPEYETNGQRKLTDRINDRDLYDRVPIDSIRRYLTAKWIFVYNYRNTLRLQCTPNIQLPWIGATKESETIDSTAPRDGKPGITDGQIIEVEDDSEIDNDNEPVTVHTQSNPAGLETKTPEK